MQLEEIIKQKIKKEGPVSFHDFMEMALYYPGLGYYTSPKDKIGASGDFYTSPDLGPVFGAMLGRQLEQMWELSGRKPFVIVEYGAGTGLLCHDILDYLKGNKEMYVKLQYCIIEKSMFMRDKARKHLDGKVQWMDSIAEVPYDISCILSNEMIDNLAVHQVVMENEVMEVFVDYHDGFVERLQPAGAALKNYLQALNINLPEGYRTEINLEAAAWISEVAGKLKNGFLITIDYGYRSAELYKDCRSAGTLMCYKNHEINDEPYSHIGEQDITSHVNFSALVHWGEQHGLTYCGLTNQAFFLLSLGFKEYLRRQETGNPIQQAIQEARLTHTLLMDMGEKFKVLIQRKGMPDYTLNGLKQPAMAAF